MRKRKWEEYPALQKDIDARKGGFNRKMRDPGTGWDSILAFGPFIVTFCYFAKVRRAFMRAAYKEAAPCKIR